MSVIRHGPFELLLRNGGKKKSLDLVEVLLESGYSEAKFENSYM